MGAKKLSNYESTRWDRRVIDYLIEFVSSELLIKCQKKRIRSPLITQREVSSDRLSAITLKQKQGVRAKSRTNDWLYSVKTQDIEYSYWAFTKAGLKTDGFFVAGIKTMRETRLTLRAIFLSLFIAENCFSRDKTAESSGLSGATPPTWTQGWPEWNLKGSNKNRSQFAIDYPSSVQKV